MQIQPGGINFNILVYGSYSRTIDKNNQSSIHLKLPHLLCALLIINFDTRLWVQLNDRPGAVGRSRTARAPPGTEMARR